MKLASVSVDLDSLPLYCRIHGLPESILDDGARRLIYRTALPRCLELFSNLSIRATLFAVGQDLDSEGRAALQSAHRGGCEVANHSYAHDYALTRQPDASISTDIKRAAEALLKQSPGEPRLAALWDTLAHALVKAGAGEENLKKAKRYRALMGAQARAKVTKPG